MTRSSIPAFDLIFHRTDGAASPFDAALREVVHDASLPCLTSPYIGLQYLRSLLNGKPFRLVTDLDEWLRSSPRQIPSILTFLDESHESVRHLAGLHAKVAIGGSKAFLGSANFTRTGLSLRDEMSVLIYDLASVAELNEWFDGLWSRAVVPDLGELQAAAGAIVEARTSKPSAPRLKNTGARIRAALKIPIPEMAAKQATSPASEPTQEAIPVVPTLSFKAMQRGLFSTVVGNLIASNDPEPRHQKLLAGLHGVMMKGATFRDLLRAARKVDSWIKARELMSDLRNHEVSVDRLLDGSITGDVIRIGGKWFLIEAAHDYFAAIDAYLAWLVKRLSADDYKPIPKADLAGSFNVPVELASQLIDQLIRFDFIATDEAGNGVLTGEAAWGSLQLRLPRFAAAWSKHGLSLDAPVNERFLGNEEREDFEEFLIAVIDALAIGPCPRAASRWPPPRCGSVARHLYSSENRAFLQQLLHSNLVEVLLDDGHGDGVVILNRDTGIAADLEASGLHQAAERVLASVRR